MMTPTIWSKTTGQGRDLVLIHGWGMNAAVWDELLPNLEAGFRVTRVDLPGHGLSREHALGELEDVAKALSDVIPKESVLLAWSLGGLIAMQLAAAFPERARRLLLVSTSPCFVRRDDWSAALDAEVFALFERGLLDDYSGTLRRFLGLQLKGVDQARELMRGLRQKLDLHPPDPLALQQGLRLLHGSDLRALLAGLDMPVSLLLGERDTLVPHTVAQSMIAECHVRDVEIVSGSAHVPFLTHQGQFLDWLERKVND
jgi:pimeloyl-[acyl-carrier protein] methyl ester esterase